MKPATAEAYQLLHEGTLALARCEANGIKVDETFLDDATTRIGRKIDRIQQRLAADKLWTKTWKKEFASSAKLTSPQQLTRVLFDVLKFPAPEFTAKSLAKGEFRYKSDEESLSQVDHPFVRGWIRMRGLQKLHSTYLKGIKREIIQGLIHPFFSLNTVRTFRSGSDSPNFQNLPIRDPEIGKWIRPAFISRWDDGVLVENDFKGAEVRIGYDYHLDPNMRRYLLDPKFDMHKDAALSLFFLDSLSQVNKQIKDAVKGDFVFASFYGSYYANIAPKLWATINDGLITADDIRIKDLLKQNNIKSLEGFTTHIQRQEERLWTETFPGYAAWKREWYDQFLRRGYLRLKSGFVIQGYSGERGVLTRNDATNYPIQGSSFHCLLWCLIELQKELRRRKMRALIIGQIHDSILADVPRRELQDYLHLVKEIVEERLPEAWKWLVIPMIIEAEVCEESWWTKKPWVERSGTWQPEAT